METITNALTIVFSRISTVVSALVTTGDVAGGLSELLPLFAIGILFSVVFLALKAIKTIVLGV